MAGTARTSARHAARFVSHVLILSGTLLLADAGATLAWEEPVSAFTANRQQAKLGKALETPPRRVLLRKPLAGDALGRIELPTLGRKYYIVQGTDAASLKKGPGHYPKTPLPGQKGTVGIAGHRTTHGAPFRTIDKLKRGDDVILSMTNGRFVYRVQKTRIVAPTEVSVTRSVGYNRLVLSACHPLYSAAQRIIVFARQVKREPAEFTRKR